MNQPLPDTGARTQFQTGAVRDSMQGKGFPHMIPPIAIRKIAHRFEDGSGKYGPSNWMKGIPLSRYQDAIIRHTIAWAEGDTGEDHLGAVGWNMAAAAWTEDAIERGLLPPALNDLPFRYNTPESFYRFLDTLPAPSAPKQDTYQTNPTLHGDEPGVREAIQAAVTHTDEPATYINYNGARFRLLSRIEAQGLCPYQFLICTPAGKHEWQTSYRHRYITADDTRFYDYAIYDPEP